MRKYMWLWAMPIVILILFAIHSLSIKQKQVETESVEFAGEAPDFTLSDIDGKRISLSDFKGKVILIDFWATWCPFCRESIPILKSLYSDYKDKGLEVVGIALEYDGGKTLKRFAEEKNIDYPLAVGDERLATEYSAYGVPTRFLINREGKIVQKFVGFQDKEIFESAINKLL